MGGFEALGRKNPGEKIKTKPGNTKAGLGKPVGIPIESG